MALVKQGQDLNADGKLDEAIALYQKALQLVPDLYDAQLYMGVALDLQGKYAEARQHLAKAIELASEAQTTQSLRVMAVSYAFEHNTAKASEHERRAYDLQYNWSRYGDAAATCSWALEACPRRAVMRAMAPSQRKFHRSFSAGVRLGTFSPVERPV